MWWGCTPPNGTEDVHICFWDICIMHGSSVYVCNTVFYVCTQQRCLRRWVRQTWEQTTCTSIQLFFLRIISLEIYLPYRYLFTLFTTYKDHIYNVGIYIYKHNGEYDFAFCILVCCCERREETAKPHTLCAVLAGPWSFLCHAFKGLNCQLSCKYLIQGNFVKFYAFCTVCDLNQLCWVEYFVNMVKEHIKIKWVQYVNVH